MFLFTLHTGRLEDVHLLELSRKITSAQELEDLGIKVLKLRGYKIKAALYDHSNSIQAATHDVISSWVQKQSSRQEAYTTLLTGLKEAELHQLAGELQELVEGMVEQPSATLDRGMLSM